MSDIRHRDIRFNDAEGAPVNVSAVNPLPVTAAGAGAATEATLATRLSEAEFETRIGEVSATPSANTVLARLKAIADALAALATEASLATLAGAVAGSEVQVDVVGALPAGTNLLGAILAALRTDVIYAGTTALTPKFFAAAPNSDGDLIAAVEGKKIRVLQLWAQAQATVAFGLESGDGTGDVLAGPFSWANKDGMALQFSLIGHFETVSGEALYIDFSVAGTVVLLGAYVEV